MNDCFRLSLMFNDSYAFRNYPVLTESQQVHQSIVPDMSSESWTGFRRCEVCNELLDKWNEPLTGLKLNKIKLDIGCTYDGIDVVSCRFKDVYESAGLIGLSFRQLPAAPKFFAIRANRAVKYDAERRGTSFENKCSVCGCYESVTGATPVYLKPGAEIRDNEFVRTDLEFASYDEKSPILICGATAAKVLKSAKLKGLDMQLVKTLGSA